MRIGVFGGTFDPPHTGHLLVAQDARDALSLDLLLVVPAATQPLKGATSSAAHHRLAMTKLCFDQMGGVTVDAVEIDRGGLSFMVDTLDSIQRRFPLAELHLLIGEDVVATLPRWREPDRLVQAAQLVVLRRNPNLKPGVVQAVELSSATAVATDQTVETVVARAIRSAVQLETRVIELSSSEVRDRVREGRSIRGFVSVAVEDYIAAAGLYVRVP